MPEVDIGDQSLKIDELKTKYKDFLVPTFEISIEGKSLKNEKIATANITVDTSVEKADTCSFMVLNAFDAEKGEYKWLDQYFSLGKYVEIQMGYEDKLEPVFYGVITSVTFGFSPDGDTSITVGGMDISFKMMKGAKSMSWTKKKHSDVVKTIASSYGVSKTVADATGVTYEIVEQSLTSDYKFISWMAKQNNYEFFITGKNLYFRQPHKNKKPVITVTAKDYLISLQIGADIADQTGDIMVRGWDSKKKEEIEAKSGDVKKVGNKSKTGPEILKKVCGSDTKEYVYTSVASKEEAEQLATAILNEHAMKLISGTLEYTGIPEIRAGKYIEITGIGKQLEQTYYITSATHTIDSSGYKVSVSLGGNTI